MLYEILETVLQGPEVDRHVKDLYGVFVIYMQGCDKYILG